MEKGRGRFFFKGEGKKAHTMVFEERKRNPLSREGRDSRG